MEKNNNKLPIKHNNTELYSWLTSQRIRYKNKPPSITPDQIEKLLSIGFDLEGKGNERNYQQWLLMFDEYKTFIQHNHREPIAKIENKLYIWAQTQRSHFANT